MRRRTILAAAGVGIPTPLVGCLDGADEGADDETGTPSGENGDDDSNGTDSNGPSNGTYEECALVEIDYEWLPEEIRGEVDNALEDGSYATDNLAFARAVDTERSYLVVDGVAYKPIVDGGGGTGSDGDNTSGDGDNAGSDGDGDAPEVTLEFEDVNAVEAPSPRTIEITNRTEREVDVTVELVDEDDGDEAIVDETVSVEPDGQHDLEATARFGTYELTARTNDGKLEETSGFAVSDSASDGFVEVSDDELFVTQSVADLEPCPWDVTVS